MSIDKGINKVFATSSCLIEVVSKELPVVNLIFNKLLCGERLWRGGGLNPCGVLISVSIVVDDSALSGVTVSACSARLLSIMEETGGASEMDNEANVGNIKTGAKRRSCDDDFELWMRRLPEVIDVLEFDCGHCSMIEADRDILTVIPFANKLRYFLLKLLCLLAVESEDQDFRGVCLLEE